MSRIALVLAALAAAVPSHARQRPQPTGTGLILGQVVDADTGRGVANVVVTIGTPLARPPSAELVDIGNPQMPGGQTQRVFTAADGRFVFMNLPQGRYALVTAAPDYVPGEHGQTRPLGPALPIDLDEGQRLGGVTVRVWKMATITGTVLDEHGEPAPGVLVRPLRRVIAGGRPRFASAGTDTTDDRGMYRIASLPPGEYAVGVIANHETIPMAAVQAAVEAADAAPRNSSPGYRAMSETAAPITTSANGIRVGDFVLRQSGGVPPRPAPADDGRILSYATQFYPAAPSASQAALVRLSSGEERAGIDLRLRLVPGVRVSGVATSPDGPAAFFGMTLVPPHGSDLQSEGMAEAAGTITDGSGAFTFLGVPPGQYLLKVRRYPRAAAAGRGAPPPPPPSEPTLWAIVPVNVGDQDVRDLAVVLKRGLIVSGRIEFTGTRPPPNADQLQRMSITLQSAEGRTSAPIAAPGRAAADATFRTAGYPAGRYIVATSTLPAGWTMTSARWNGRDVSIEPLELSEADVTDIVIALSDRTTQIAGRVTGPDGAAVANAEVIVFPADSTAWRDVGVPARRGRNLRATTGGAFAVSGLPPGEYFVAALRPNDVTDWRDPALLGRLTGIVRVTLAEGDSKTVEVRVAR